MPAMVAVISAEEALLFVKNGMTVGVGGFGGFSAPDELLRAMAEHFAAKGSPRDLTIVAGIAPGDLTEDGFGLSALRAEGIISTIIAAHVGMPPAIGRAVGADAIAGFTLPLGVYGHLLRAMAGKKPGIVTSVGLHTFADPRLDGCAMNEKARASGRKMVSLIRLDDREYLFYRSFPLDCCLIRGTYADRKGNISLEKEALYSEQRAMAAAVHNEGGVVIVQVEEVVDPGELDPRRVHVHGSVVDYVVKARPENHRQCYDGSPFRPELIGERCVPPASLPPLPLGIRKICGRRGALELRAGTLVNLGIGMPESVASVANEEGIAEKVTFSVETGLFGGIPAGGVAMGASVNPEALCPIVDNFDLYDGGALDVAFLGAAEIDAVGNVNVSKFGERCTGPGGFINISQNTHNVCFVGSFVSGNVEFKFNDGKISIVSDGNVIKFKNKIKQTTFSSIYSRKMGQNILYITERAVFRMDDDGLILIEIAPGVSLEKDIFGKMEFRPRISDDLKLMDSRIFVDKKMNIKF